MAYPTLEQYNEALHSPHLVLLDPELKLGEVKKNGLGGPLALCGGFALTYSMRVGAKRFALRCFHKESRELERRYQAISTRLKQLNSPYFLPFEFHPQGIRIQGKAYPIVKMAWAEGTTLAEFLESEHRNTNALRQLRQALSSLAAYLEQNQIAHGDIQPENVMVSRAGSAVQLIDYDGMYVEALKGSKATELGQVNFQHPQRTADQFDARLDRFSFLTLDVALQTLSVSPSIWDTSRSEPSAVVFRRSDFLDPSSSSVFQDAIRLSGLKGPVENLARVAAGAFSATPTLLDFLQGRGISVAPFVIRPSAAGAAAYVGAYVVCDATNYEQVLRQVGNRIELIGKVHSIKEGLGKNRKRYVFVNFSDWRGKAVKLSIWSDGMDAIRPHAPDEGWVGRWISVTGLVDPAFHGKVGSVSYTHLSITISAKGQIQQLPEQEAKFRLGALGKSSAPAPLAPIRNASILQEMSGPSSSRPNTVVVTRVPAAPPKSSNQRLLESMRQQTPASAPSPPTPPPAPRSAAPSVKPSPAPRSAAPVAKPSPAPRPQPNSNWGWLRVLIVVVVILLILRALFG